MTGIARQTRVREYGLDPGTEDVAYRTGMGELFPGNSLDMGPTAEARRAEALQ